MQFIKLHRRWLFKMIFGVSDLFLKVCRFAIIIPDRGNDESCYSIFWLIVIIMFSPVPLAEMRM